MPATAAPIDVVPTLRSLLTVEQLSAWHFLATAGAYVRPACAALRRQLADIAAATARREGELAMLIEDLGQTAPPLEFSREHHSMAYLSCDYLLPKLRADKSASIERYERALEAVKVHALATELVRRHLDEHRRELATLDGAAAARN